MSSIDWEARESARQISDTVTNLRTQLEKTQALLNKAITAMTELHANIIPPDDEISDPTVLFSAFSEFVDIHAELMYERHQLLGTADD
jgi:hypothetical protein